LLRWCRDRDGSPALASDACTHLAALQAREIDGLLHLALRKEHPLQAACDRLFAVQRAALCEVAEELARRRVEPVVLYDAEAIARFFDGRGVGVLPELELLVPRTAAGAVKQSLHRLAFRQARLDGETAALVELDVAELATAELPGIALAPFRRRERIAIAAGEPLPPGAAIGPDGGSAVMTTIRVSFQVGADIPSEPLQARARPSAIAALALSPTDQLWIALSRHYRETALGARRSLRALALAMPLVSPATALDWEVVVRAGRDHALRASLFYPLAFLARLGGRVPDEVLAELRPGAGDCDLGWQLGPLFGVTDPFPLTLD
jgi:hypothetical protein